MMILVISRRLSCSGRSQRCSGQHGAGRLEVAHVRHRQGLRLARRPGCHPLHGNPVNPYFEPSYCF